MKAQPKPTYQEGGHFSGSFDSRLKDAINKVKGISYAEKIKLYQAILGICHQQVEDCCDSLTAALYLNLHDDHGFGQTRISHLRDSTQATVDAYAAKYEIGMLAALLRDLESRRITIKTRGEGEK